MNRIIRLHIEKLPEGVWLATSDDIQGLLAQGDTLEETLDIARDVARTLIEMGAESKAQTASDNFDLPIVFAA